MKKASRVALSLAMVLMAAAAVVLQAPRGQAQQPGTPMLNAATQRVYLPLIVKPHGEDALDNGGFESGDLAGWRHGGSLQRRVATSDVHGGQYAAVLGNPEAPACDAPSGEAWIEQEFAVRAGAGVSLSLWYRLFTYDKNPGLADTIDHFDVWLNGERIWRDANQTLENTCEGPPHDLGWRRWVYDLSAHSGRVATLRVVLASTDRWWNTWVWVDDVQVLEVALEPTPTATATSGPTPTRALTSTPTPPRIVSMFRAPNPPADLTWDGEHLWMVSEQTATLHRIDPKTGTGLASYLLPSYGQDDPNGWGLTWDGEHLWHSDYGQPPTIYQLDPSDGSIIRSFEVWYYLGLAWDGSYLWGANPGADEIHKLDPASGAVLHTVPAPGSHCIGLTWVAGTLWTTDLDSSMMYEIDPEDGRVLCSFACPGSSPTGLAFDGAYLWHGDWDRSMIYKMTFRSDVQ